MEADVEWMKSGVKLSTSNNGRITLGDIIVDSPGREYRRSLLVTWALTAAQLLLGQL